MRVLLTGGDGFIGGNLRRYLDERYKLDVFDGDCTKPQDWKRFRGPYAAVFHLAALVGTEDSMRRSALYVRNNVLGTAVMLEQVRGAGKIVLAASAAVYGDQAGRLSEQNPVQPNSVYGLTKWDQEQLCRFSGIPTTALRLFAVYGPGQYGGVGGVLGMLAEQIGAGKRPTVYEDGTQLRDFINVADVCAAFDAGFRGPVGVYNIGTGVATTVGAAAHNLSEELGGPDPIFTNTRRVGDVRDVVCDPSLAAAELGWKAEVAFEDGLRDYARWVKRR